MAFLGSLDNNIRQYRENVNLKRMDVSGLYLENIPEKLSFEQNEKDILEIIGKQFETDSNVYFSMMI